MEQFPSNSHNIGGPKKPPAERPAVEPVITGKAIKRKIPLGQRFKKLFFGGDAKSVVRYVMGEVLIPAAKNMFVDTVEQGAKRMVYGDSAPRRSSPLFGQPRFSYNRPVDRGVPLSTMLPGQPPRYPTASRQPSNEMLYYSRDDAERVLEGLRDIIDKYQVVSVADLNALSNLPSAYTDNSWGWFNLSRVDIHQTHEGFVLILPQAEQL